MLKIASGMSGDARAAGVLRRAGLAFNGLLRWNAALAAAYLSAWGRALELLRDDHWFKVHVGNNLRSTPWPAQLALAPRRVQLAGDIDADLVPRPGSLAFRALYQRRIQHEEFVFDFLQPRMARYDAVLEVGANIGLYTVYFSRWLARRDAQPRVFAFEPSPQAFACLQEHLELNRCGNVVARSEAVAGASGQVEFFANPLDFMKGSLSRGAAAQFDGAQATPMQVRAVTSSEIAPLLRGFRSVLLKIDVVGGEPAVLAGLRPLIEELRPDIVLGVWSENLAGLNALDFLRGRYRLHRIEPGALRARSDFSDPDYCNYFLEPVDSGSLQASAATKGR